MVSRLDADRAPPSARNRFRVDPGREKNRHDRRAAVLVVSSIARVDCAFVVDGFIGSIDLHISAIFGSIVMDICNLNPCRAGDSDTVVRRGNFAENHRIRSRVHATNPISDISNGCRVAGGYG